MIVRFVVKENIPPPARTAAKVISANMGISPKAALQLIYDRLVLCDGRVVTAGHLKLSVGSFIEVEKIELPKPTPVPRVAAASKRFEILHEDEHIVVVSKPAGVLTVPTDGRQSGSLKQQLEKHFQKSSGGGRGRRSRDAGELTCVHRLDRSVSGVLVFARTKPAAQYLREQFQHHTAGRQYVAIVAGAMEADNGKFDANLATEGDLHVRTTDGNDGQSAITHFQVQERVRGATIVNVHLETGRRNQIRVHFADAGHPVLGDPRYSASRAVHPAWAYQRVALHASTLTLRHPESRDEMVFQQSWPREFGAFIKAQRK